MSAALDGRELASEGLSDWAYLLRRLHARFAIPDYATGLRLVAAIGAAAEEQDHHPDLDLRHGVLNVRLWSHDMGRVTTRDVRLARRISELAAEEGVTSDPSGIVVTELALDVDDLTAIKPFWAAVLGLEDTDADELSDRRGSQPTMWFQSTDPHPEPRQRFHLDVWVTPEAAPSRIEATLAAGGTLVSDDEAPSFWVLADARANKACICTWQDRSH